jgi:hypothetical protein
MSPEKALITIATLENDLAAAKKERNELKKKSTSIGPGATVAIVNGTAALAGSAVGALDRLAPEVPQLGDVVVGLAGTAAQVLALIVDDADASRAFSAIGSGATAPIVFNAARSAVAGAIDEMDADIAAAAGAAGSPAKPTTRAPQPTI